MKNIHYVRSRRRKMYKFPVVLIEEITMVVIIDKDIKPSIIVYKCKTGGPCGRLAICACRRQEKY